MMSDTGGKREDKDWKRPKRRNILQSQVVEI
jgi:hypothetical protein